MTAISSITDRTIPGLLDYLFNSTILRKMGQDTEETGWFPVETIETKSTLTFQVELSGINFTHTSVNFHRGQLMIQVICQPHSTQHPDHLIHQWRDFPLPAAAKVAHASVTFHNDVLEVTIPKAPSRVFR